MAEERLALVNHLIDLYGALGDAVVLQVFVATVRRMACDFKENKNFDAYYINDKLKGSDFPIA